MYTVYLSIYMLPIDRRCQAEAAIADHQVTTQKHCSF